MITSSWVKYSGNKIVTISGLPGGDCSGEDHPKEIQPPIQTCNVRRLDRTYATLENGLFFVEQNRGVKYSDRKCTGK